MDFNEGNQYYEEEDSSRVHPEDQNKTARCKPISDMENPPMKKKRRFIYYFLCIFITFLIVRICLIGISIYGLDFNKLILKNMKYDSSNPESIRLEFQMAEAYSPLFIRIKDIECDVYADDADKKKRRLFSLDIPDIEIVKYKTLSFKNDITFKGFNPDDLYECRNTTFMTIKMKVKLYYRVCLMLFYVNLNKEQTVRIRDEQNKVRWPRFNEIAVRNEGDRIAVAFDIDHSSIVLPSYLNIALAESEIKCGRDLPCSISFSEQNVENGKFKSPLVMTVSVKKEDYSKIISSIIDLVNAKDIYYEIVEVITNRTEEVKSRYKVAFTRMVSREELPVEKTEDKQEANPDVEKNASPGWRAFGPVALVEDVAVNGSTISCNIKVDPKVLSIIKKDTVLVFDKLNIHSKIRMFDHLVATGEVTISSDNAYVNIALVLVIKDIQRAVDYLVNGNLNVSFELGDDKKKHSFLKGLRMDYNNSGWSIFYQVFNYKFPIQEEKESPDFEISYDVSANSNSVVVKSSLGRKTPVSDFDGKPIVLFKIPEINLKLEHEFFKGNLVLNKYDSVYVIGDGFLGTHISKMVLEPRMDKFDGRADLKNLFVPKVTFSADQDGLAYTYNPPQASGKGFDKQKVYIDYEKCDGFQNHTLSVGIPFGSLLNSDKLTHKLFIPKNLISLGFYTRGVPLRDLRPNISVEPFDAVIPSKQVHKAVKLSVYLGNLDLVKALMYGDFAFYSNSNVLSFVLAQYLNHLMSQKEPPVGKIINKECRFNLQLDGSEAVEHEGKVSSVYTGQIRLEMPHEVIDSFMFDSLRLPDAFFYFEGFPRKSHFEIKNGQDETGRFIEVGFRVDPEIFNDEGTELLWKTIAPVPRDPEKPKGERNQGRIKVSNGLVKVLRMFFVKCFDPVLENTPSPRIGLYASYDDFKFVQPPDDNSVSLKTKTSVVFYADPMEGFFYNTLPGIMLKCGFGVVPKYFRMTMATKRLELLYLKYSSQGCLKAWAKDVKSDSLYQMNYPDLMSIIPEEYKIDKPDTPYTKGIPPEVLQSKGKFVFEGDVFAEFVKDPVITKIQVETPFPLFLVNIMKAPGKDSTVSFVRSSFLDFAIGLPFSLDVRSENDLQYELSYKDLTLLKDYLFYDQGKDKFVHFSLRSLNTASLYEMIKALTNEEDEAFRITLSQKDTTLIDTSFHLHRSIYRNLKYHSARCMNILSGCMKTHKKEILSFVKRFAG